MCEGLCAGDRSLRQGLQAAHPYQGAGLLPQPRHRGGPAAPGEGAASFAPGVPGQQGAPAGEGHFQGVGAGSVCVEGTGCRRRNKEGTFWMDKGLEAISYNPSVGDCSGGREDRLVCRAGEPAV
jgi:hypothetical protein